MKNLFTLLTILSISLSVSAQKTIFNTVKVEQYDTITIYVPENHELIVTQGSISPWVYMEIDIESNMSYLIVDAVVKSGRYKYTFNNGEIRMWTDNKLRTVPNKGVFEDVLTYKVQIPRNKQVKIIRTKV